MNTLTLLVVCLVITPVMAAVHYANDHPVLWDLISNSPFADNTGNNIVDNGDSVGVGEGTFLGAPYASSDRVYWTSRIYFSLVCSGALHSCVLDGSNSRRLMFIEHTHTHTMTLSGVHFKDSNNNYGGALFILSALVSIEACKISSNQASNGGGIAAWNSGTTVNLYSTSFDGNSASDGDDIYVYQASLTVHSTCPPDWSGTPAAGSDLDTYISSTGGTISGTTKSFDIG